MCACVSIPPRRRNARAQSGQLILNYRFACSPLFRKPLQICRGTSTVTGKHATIHFPLGTWNSGRRVLVTLLCMSKVTPFHERPPRRNRTDAPDGTSSTVGLSHSPSRIRTNEPDGASSTLRVGSSVSKNNFDPDEWGPETRFCFRLLCGTPIQRRCGSSLPLQLAPEAEQDANVGMSLHLTLDCTIQFRLAQAVDYVDQSKVSSFTVTGPPAALQLFGGELQGTMSPRKPISLVERWSTCECWDTKGRFVLFFCIPSLWRRGARHRSDDPRRL